MPCVSRCCPDLWKTATAPLEPPPIPSASSGGQGQSQSQKKRRVVGTVLSKPAAQSHTTPEEPSPGELEALSRSYDVGDLRAVLRTYTHLFFCRGVANSLVGLVVKKPQPTIFGKCDGAEKCLEHGTITRRADSESLVSQLS